MRALPYQFKQHTAGLTDHIIIYNDRSKLLLRALLANRFKLSTRNQQAISRWVSGFYGTAILTQPYWYDNNNFLIGYKRNSKCCYIQVMPNYKNKFKWKKELKQKEPSALWH